MSESRLQDDTAPARSGKHNHARRITPKGWRMHLCGIANRMRKAGATPTQIHDAELRAERENRVWHPYSKLAVHHLAGGEVVCGTKLTALQFETRVTTDATLATCMKCCALAQAHEVAQ